MQTLRLFKIRNLKACKICQQNKIYLKNVDRPLVSIYVVNATKGSRCAKEGYWEIIDTEFEVLKIVLKGENSSGQQIPELRGFGHKRSVEHESSVLIESDSQKVSII